MAVASALGARDCIHSGRDSRFSAQQIWDCSATGIATCEEGVYLNTMLRRMGSGTNSPYTLLPESCATELGTTPNATRCLNRILGCTPPSGELFLLNARTQALLMFDTLVFRGPSDYTGTVNAMHSMMFEILAHGPVVSVLTLIGADIGHFVTWPQHSTPGSVFIPPSLLATLAAANASHTTSSPPQQQQQQQQQQSLRHCLMVYGWGGRGAATLGAAFTTTGNDLPFWRVQNSYGGAWGDQGLAHILRGANVLEASWRAIATLPRRCTQGAPSDGTVDEPCLPPPYGQYATVGAAADLLPPPLSSSSSPVPGAPASTTTTTTSTSTPQAVPHIDNAAIVAVAFACAAVVTGLAALILRPVSTTPTIPTLQVPQPYFAQVLLNSRTASLS
jgi:hypothetical protein